MARATPTVLLTSACGPFDTYGFDEPIFDVFTNRLTKGQDLFTLRGHFHFPPLHTIAQNIGVPCTVLEIPSVETFEEEVKKGYDYIGITANIVHMDTIFDMCRRIRERSPKTEIVLGGYGIQCLGEVFRSDAELKDVADHICHGEGIRFMRALLGQPPLQRPLEILPACNSTLAFLPQVDTRGASIGGMSYLTSGLGCPNLCEFCSTSHFYDGQYIELSDAEALYEGLKRNLRLGRGSMIWDEDLPQKKDKMDQLRHFIEKDTEFGANNFNYFTFGSIRALSQYDPEELLLSGMQVVWIGVESLYSMLGKRQGLHGGALGGKEEQAADVRRVFADLQNAGIQTVGSWICGWDFHDHTNILADREFFVSLRPTLSQISQLLPVPETALWERLKEEGRLYDDVPWKDMHFYGGAYKFKNFEKHEMLFFVEETCRRLYEVQGPSVTRMMENAMNGYEFCRKSKNAVIRDQKGAQFKQMAMGTYALLPTAIAFAPNGYVRRNLKELDRRWRALFGKPQPGMEAMGQFALAAATDYMKKRNTVPPPSHYDQEYVAKRYEYGPNTHDIILQNKKPYQVTYPEGFPKPKKGGLSLPEGMAPLFSRSRSMAGLDQSPM